MLVSISWSWLRVWCLCVFNAAGIWTAFVLSFKLVSRRLDMQLDLLLLLVPADELVRGILLPAVLLSS